MKIHGPKGLPQALTIAVMALILSGCAHALSAVDQDIEGASVQATCCENPEPYPRALVNLADAHAPVFGRAIAHAVVRPGWLAFYPSTIQELVDTLWPLDVLLTRAEGRLTNKLIPGAFAHTVVHVGSEEQLRHLRVWQHPAVIPHHAELRAGGVFIHATSAGVHASTASDIFNVDDVVVLRPQGLHAARRRQVIAHLFQHIGTPFDFRADVDDASCFTCIELVHHVLPELDLPVRRIYDRRVILPDEVIVRALNGDRRLRFQAYARARPFGSRLAGPNTLAADIRAAWPSPQFRQAMH
jgi:hypothetical protein